MSSCPKGSLNINGVCAKEGDECPSERDGYKYVVSTGICLEAYPIQCLDTHAFVDASAGCVLIGSECTDTSDDGFKYVISQTGACVKANECIDTHVFSPASDPVFPNSDDACLKIEDDCTSSLQSNPFGRRHIIQDYSSWSANEYAVCVPTGDCADTHVLDPNPNGDRCVKIPEPGDECNGADDGFAYVHDDTMACVKTDSCLSFYTRTAEGTCKARFDKYYTNDACDVEAAPGVKPWHDLYKNFYVNYKDACEEAYTANGRINFDEAMANVGEAVGEAMANVLVELPPLYTDDACTTVSDLSKEDPVFHMKVGTDYYRKVFDSCQKIKKTKTYMTMPTWPKQSVCITQDGKETCLEHVANSGQLQGCEFMNNHHIEKKVGKIDCRKEGKPPVFGG